MPASPSVVKSVIRSMIAPSRISRGASQLMKCCSIHSSSAVPSRMPLGELMPPTTIIANSRSSCEKLNTLLLAPAS